MDAWMWIVIAIAVIAAAAAAVWAASRRRRSAELRDSFGPEYERTLDLTGDRHRAEAELAARRERRERLDIVELPDEDRDRFADAWRAAQARFVDQPHEALLEADLLVLDVMRARGYPIEDFEQRAADVSVDHPQVVEHYRAAHDVSRDAADRRLDTERLREGMLHYRALFAELLGADVTADRPGVERPIRG
jgi:hypothetical protein